MRKLLLAIASVFVVSAWPAAAQPALRVSKAELSVPFGSVSGKLAVVGDYLIFIDEDKTDRSFALRKSEIQNFQVDGNTLRVQAAHPVNMEAGSISNLNFKLQGGADPSQLSNWYGSPGPEPATAPVVAPAAPVGPEAAAAPMPSFTVRHKKRFRGDSHGKLIITADGLRYESIDDVNDSRSWPFKDIKELKHGSTYQLEIVPFNGDNYNFEVQGSGMTHDQFNSLVNKVTQARAGG